MTWTSQYKDTDDVVVLPPSSQSPQEWIQYLTDQDANANGDEKSHQAMQQRSKDHSNNNSNNNNRSCDNKSVQTYLCDQLRQLHQWWLYQRPNLVDSLHRTQRIYYHRREQLTTVQQRFHILQESRKRNEMNRTTTTTSNDLKKTTTPTKDSNNKHNNNDKNQSLLQHMLLTQISEMLEYYQSQTRLSASSSLSFVNHQQDMETLSSFFPILSHFAMNHNKDPQVFIHDDDHHHDDNEKKEINQKAMVLEVMMIRTFLIEKHEQITSNVNDKTTTSNTNNEISTTTNTTMVDPLALSFSTVTVEDISRWLETIQSFLFLSTPKDSLGNMSGDMSNGISQSSYDDNDNNKDDTNNKYNINKYNNKSVLWRIPTLSSWNDLPRHDDSSCSLELSLDMFQKELEQLVHDLQQHCLQKQNKLRQLDHEMALLKVHLERDITKYIHKKRQLYTNSRTTTTMTVHNKPSSTTTTLDKDKTEIVENEIENDVDDDDDDDFRIEIRPMGPLLLEQGPPIT